MLGLSLNAQITHFNQVVGTNFIPTGSVTNTGMGSVRLPSGNFVTVSVSESQGFQVKQFNSSGILLLTTEISPSTYYISTVYSVKEHLNNLYVSGFTTLGTSGPAQFYIAKINLATNAVTFTYKPIGAFQYTSGPTVMITNDGIFASFPEYTRFNLARYDFNLNNKWTRTCEPDSSAGKNPSMDCEMIDDTTIIVLGKADTDLGCGDYDTSGRLDTFRVFYPGTSTYTRMYSMTKTTDNKIVAAGLCYSSFSSTAYYAPVITKMNRYGQVVWSKEYNPGSGTPIFERFTEVIQLANGNIAAFATDFEAYNDTYSNGVVVFDANGNQLFSKYFGDFNTTYRIYDIKPYDDGVLFSGIRSSSDGSQVVDENFMAFTDFTFAPMCNVTNYSLPFLTHYTGYLANYSGDDIKKGTGMNSTTFNYGTLTLAANPAVVVCASTGLNEEVTDEITTGVYPNPIESGAALTVTMSETADYTITVTDFTGKTIRTMNLNGNTTTINTSDFASGAYLLNVSLNGKSISVEKLLVK